MSLFEDPRLNPLRRDDRQFIGGLAAVLAVLLFSCAVWHDWQGRPLTRLKRENLTTTVTAEFRLDINQAEWPELAMLPRVGEVLARRIVAFRDSSGPFTTVEQLDDVKGIGPTVLSGIREFVKPLNEPLNHDQSKLEGPR